MEKEKYSLQNIQRVAWILKAFSEQKAPLSLATLTKITGINKTTIFRIMTTFIEEGFFKYNAETKKYQFGNEFLKLSANLVGNFDLREIVLPFMDELRDTVNETVALYIRKETDKYSIAKSDGTYPVRRNVNIGERTPLHCSAGGKVLLAFAPPKIQIELLDTMKFEKFTVHTVTERSKLEKQLRDIVVNGYAISSEERYEGAISIAAPIFDRENRIIAAINILAPVFRMQDNTKHIELLKDTAKKISAELPADIELNL